MNDGRSAPRKDHWDYGATYEPYVGRWSRLVAQKFLAWLNVPEGGAWLEVGCGTGALTQSILQLAHPREIKAVDHSESYLAFARERIADERVSFALSDAQTLPANSSTYDAVVSGLVLNFIPDMQSALREMMRVAAPEGVIAAYVWDYAGEMQMMRYFWDAAAALHAEASALDEGRRFPICRPEPLAALFGGEGLNQVDVKSIDVETHFRDFDDYWTPFLGGQGPAPGYVMSLNEAERSRLRDLIRSRLPVHSDGSIALTARAWAVRGFRG